MMIRSAALARVFVLVIGFVAPSLFAVVPVLADQEPILARYAVLLGDRDQKAPPGVGAPATAPADELLQWDYQRDNAELERLFGLSTVHTLQIGSARLPGDGGRFAATVQLDAEELTVRARVTLQDAEPTADRTGSIAVFQLEIRVGDEVLSAPTVSTWLGERAIVSTNSGGDDARVLWVVVQVDRLPLRE